MTTIQSRAVVTSCAVRDKPVGVPEWWKRQARAPATSTIAKPLADYINLPLPDEAVEEVGEMASVALRLKRLNPDRLKFMAEQLRDVLEGEEQRARTTKPPDVGDHATTGKGAPGTRAPGTGAGARAPRHRRTRH